MSKIAAARREGRIAARLGAVVAVASVIAMEQTQDVVVSKEMRTANCNVLSSRIASCVVCRVRELDANSARHITFVTQETRTRLGDAHNAKLLTLLPSDRQRRPTTLFSHLLHPLARALLDAQSRRSRKKAVKLP
jgi:hypothetical protein